jgi:hypothetical protein
MSTSYDRRRRLMADDLLLSEAADDDDLAPAATSAPRGGEPARRVYAAAAECALNRPIREFFPSRAAMILVTAAVALAAVGSVVAIDIWAGSWTHGIDSRAAAVFDLNAPGNLTGWIASTLLAAAGLVAIYIYSLRRHRVDDYHGRYRVWIWAAIGLMLVSMTETSTAGQPVRGLGIRLFAWLRMRESIAWPAAVLGIVAIAYVRLLCEMWRCRTAAALWTLASGAFVAAAAAEYGWLFHAPDATRTLAERCGWLAGYLLAMVALLVYARYVTMEIEGRVAVKPAKAKKPKVRKAPKKSPEEPPAEPPRKPNGNVRTDLDARPGIASAGPSTTKPQPQQTSRSDDEDEYRHLSRKERKRLRREARMQSWHDR